MVCEVWRSVKCEVKSLTCEVWSVKVRSVECEV